MSCPPSARRRDPGGVQQQGPHPARLPPPRPANSLRSPPLPAGCECWGWGRPNCGGGGGGGEARRLRAPSSARDAAAAAAESLSLGHVIVSKRELRGSPASRGPLQNAARRARRCHSRRRRLSSSRRARESGGSCGAHRGAGPGQPRILPALAAAPSGPQRAPRARRPRPAVQPARAAAAETKLFPPATAYSSLPGSAASGQKTGRRGLPGAELPSPYLAAPLQENRKSAAGWLAARPGGSLLGAASLAAPASGSTSANSDLKGQSPACPVLLPSPLGRRFPRTEKKAEEAGREHGLADFSTSSSSAPSLTTWGKPPGGCGGEADAPRPPLCARVGHRRARSCERRRAEPARESGRRGAPQAAGRRPERDGERVWGRRGRGGGAGRAEWGLVETARPRQPGAERHCRPVGAGGRWRRRGRCRGRGRARTATRSRPTRTSR